jgi:putative peptidoglycan lipid II flippase
VSNLSTFGRIAGFNALGAALGVLNTFAVAFFFGTGRDVEVFLAAAALHASVMGMAQTGQVSEVLLPVYQSLRHQIGREAAQRAYTALINRFLLLLAGIAGVAWLFASMLTRLRVPGFDGDEIDLAAAMFRWVLPLVLLQVGSELLKTLANAERRFGSPEAVSAFARGASLLAIIFLADRLGTWALVVALWIAALTEVVGTLWLLRKCEFCYRPLLSLEGNVRGAELFRPLLGTLPYVLCTQVFLFAVDAAVSLLSQGSYAVFRYATLIWARTQGVFLRPVIVPFFTEFSDAVARRDEARAAVITLALSRTIAVATVVAAVVVTGGERVLAGMWAGDRFPREQVAELALLLSGFFLLLQVAGTASIWRKAAISLGLIRQTYWGLAVVQVLCAAVAWPLVSIFGLLGAWLVNAFNLVGFLAAPVIVLRLTGLSLGIRFPFDRLWQWLVAAAVGIAIAEVVGSLLGEPEISTMFDRVHLALSGILVSSAALVSTLGISLLLGVPESRRLLHLLSRRTKSATP